jgi:choline kinase
VEDALCFPTDKKSFSEAVLVGSSSGEFMNQTLAEEELDRELVVRHQRMEFGNGNVYESTTKVKVGQKTLTISNDAGKDKITFSKRAHNALKDELGIETVRQEIVYEQCSLGHRHEKSKKENVYQWFRMDWQHVESLVEWLNSGSWTAVRTRENPTERVLKEVLDLLREVESRDQLLKPIAQKLKVKIKNLGVDC